MGHSDGAKPGAALRRWVCRDMPRYAQARRDPVSRGCEGNADACGERIDHEIAQSSVASRRLILHHLECADDGYHNGCGQEPAAPVGKTEDQSHQNERKGVFALLAEIRMRPKARRTESCKTDSGEQQPSQQADQKGHWSRIARISGSPQARRAAGAQWR